MPNLSQEEETIITPVELVKELKIIVHLSTEHKLKHVQQLQQFSAIIANKPLLRVENTPPVRVGTPTSSTDATAPRVLQQLRSIYQHHTSRKTPMPSILEE